MADQSYEEWKRGMAQQASADSAYDEFKRKLAGGEPVQPAPEPDTGAAWGDYLGGIGKAALALPISPLAAAAYISKGGIDALRRPGIPGAIAEGVKGTAQDIGKDEIARLPVIAAMGPAALTMPLIERPLTKMVRAALPSQATKAIGLGEDPKTTQRDAFANGLKQGATETAINAAFLGAGALKGVPSAIAARLGEENTASAITKYFKSIIEKGGSLAEQKAAASKLYEEAAHLAPDVRVPVNALVGLKDTITKEAEQGLGMNPASKKILKEIDNAIGKGGTLTLGEINAKLRDIGRYAKSTSGKGHLQHVFLQAKDALETDLASAPEAMAGLDEAANSLIQGRAKWAEFKTNERLNDLFLKSTAKSGKAAIEGLIDPQGLANAAHGKNWDKIQKELAAYPDKLDKVRQVVNAARLMASSGKGESFAGFLPEAVKTPKVEKMLDSVMSTGQVLQTITDPEFKKFLRPHGVTSESQALEILGNIYARTAPKGQKMALGGTIAQGAKDAGNFLVDQARSLVDFGGNDKPSSPFPQDLRAQAAK